MVKCHAFKEIAKKMEDQQLPLFAKETINVSLEDEMRRSYLDYAMSVIVGRALPDVRDGLKPVHRRVLYAMHELGNDWNKAYKKSARIVGDVIGKYHPHGDLAVYHTIVRLAQYFSMRYMLVDGQGNFGSVDGDQPAAMRYTEVRMAKIGHTLLEDLEKETVDFSPNYDGSEVEPQVLPTRLPNLLVNGASGIAVGLATNIPPHNLKEVVNACLALIKKPEISVEELMQIIPAPDYPTGALIYGLEGVRDAYRTGRGKIILRAKTHLETIGKSEKLAIVVDELPYQVNKRELDIKINALVNEKRLEGIARTQDESDKSGMRLVIELKRGQNAEVVLNNLYKHTKLQDSFGMNMVALVNGRPALLNLKEMIFHFVAHRREVATRRTIFELKKAKERGHILEGLAVALSNVDEIIALIKAAPTPGEAKKNLLSRPWKSTLVDEMLARAAADAYRPDDLLPEYGAKAEGYYLSDAQAQAILELRLQRLTGLEQEKILTEYHTVMDTIADLLDILAKPERISAIIAAELEEISAQFGDERKSEIVRSTTDIDAEDLITPQDMVVTLSNAGYIKSQPLSDYRAQRRGGRGRKAAGIKDEDFIDQLFIANTHDYLLCFSNRGRCFWLRVFDAPQGGYNSRGKPIVNLFSYLESGERINAVLSVKNFDAEHYVFLATRAGVVKKMSLSDFNRPRKQPLIAISLDEGDYLIGAALTTGDNDVVLVSDAGKAVWFQEDEVRAMGRTARGVRGMKLKDKQSVLSLLVVQDKEVSVLVATENGYGKRSKLEEFRQTSRGTQGVTAIALSKRNGKVITAKLVKDDDEIMAITSGGVLIRSHVNEIRDMGRSTQGVRLIALGEGETLVGLAKVVESDEDE